MAETRQQRRARERREAVDSLRHRVAGRVTSAPSVHAMWKTFADEVLARHGIVPGDEVGDEALVWFRKAFYTGAAAMFELVTRVAPEEVSEDQGAQMLQRLEDELRIYAEGLK